jgi:BirA family biotin operon repressor/biotin-[acetyl-CoA-carboxylase] ligase
VYLNVSGQSIQSHLPNPHDVIKMTREYELLKILADGKLHSGQELAENMGVSRTAIWKHLNKIRSKNLDICTFKGKGYQLSRQIELLQHDVITRKIRSEVNHHLHSVQLLYETGSTNKLLMNMHPAHGRVIIAEYQYAGRGRSGNVWLSGLAGSLCMSIAWHYDAIPNDFNAMSLAAGVVLAQCLEKFSGKSIQLKWPNDLIYGRSKLGGILIESKGQHAGEVDVVVGIGINFKLPEQLGRMINQNVTDLASVSSNTLSRNEIAAELINGIISFLSAYPKLGFNHYIDEWRKRDFGKDCEAELHLPGKKINGRIVDIDENGNLIMSADDRFMKFGSGELSLRVLN